MHDVRRCIVSIVQKLRRSMPYQYCPNERRGQLAEVTEMVFSTNVENVHHNDHLLIFPLANQRPV